MSYLALYRKYRPHDFEDFAGQREIAESLRYQVESGTFGHSYLFSGIRGTGKTSMAKVFSKAINCLSPEKGNPCGKCESCIAFQENRLLDIIEIDAASNNGVDDVRELRENSYFVPSHSHYKVYIIDEVQMLSKEAFNALLKTLEEPSKQVVFILATTELQKIPETILSRCQRYHFERIDEKDVVSRLEHVCKKEGVEYDREALEVIASHSEGAMRDALSFMDKALSISKGKLTYDSVRTSLGILGRESVHDLLKSCFNGEMESLLQKTDHLIREGREVGSVIEELQAFLRTILLEKLVGKSAKELLSYSGPSYVDEYKEVSEKDLREAMRILDEAYRKLRYTSIPRLPLELALIEIAELNSVLRTVEVKRVVEKRGIEKVVEDIPVEEIQAGDERAYFQKILKALKDQGEHSLYYILVEAKLETLDEEKLVLSFKDDFSREAVKTSENMALLDRAIQVALGGKRQIEIFEPVTKETSELDQLKAFLGQDLDKLIIK
ncbi:DNA polymerase III subunit gamma/tau [Guggenheimella bovis]